MGSGGLDLVADIGATNARFQLCADGQLLDAAVVLPTGSYRDGEALLRDALGRLPASRPRRVLLAVAGPAGDGAQIEVTNTGLRIRRDHGERVFGCPTQLANDFFAMAHGVPYFTALEQLGGAAPQQTTKALLGPGTGLGMATLVCPETMDGMGSAAPNWLVLPSEGGHADLAPGTHLEAELWGLLAAEHEHVCWETVLSGGGLGNLYRAMSMLWGARAESLAPADILARGMDVTDPVCHQTLETFCGLLGAAAGNLAVTVTAAGGVYIGGGIVPRMLEFLPSSPLRRRFEERGAMSDYVRGIPLLVIVESEPGLLGAARYLQHTRATPDG